MKILVACEFSGIVRDAFIALGHDAWSCDLLPTELPGPHFQCDVRSILTDHWDLMIAHPPCTYITNAGVRHLHSHVASRNGVQAKVNGQARWISMREACAFFLDLKNAPIPMICIENPVPHHYATEIIGRYSQIIHPWQFGHGKHKPTCLWLKNLPLLQPTHRRDDLFCAQEPNEITNFCNLFMQGEPRWLSRSRTFPGIACAMAMQWGNQLIPA